MAYSLQLLAQLGAALGSGALVRELLAGGSFDAFTYGAVPDYDKSDATQGLQDALDAAAQVEGSVLVIRPGIYKVQDPTTALYSSAAAIEVPVTARNMTIIGLGATLKIGPNGATVGVVRDYGYGTTIIGLAVDQNYTGALQTGKDNTGFEVNGTTNASIGNVNGVNGTNCLLLLCKTFGGDTSNNLNPNQGSEGVKLINATNCGVAFCDVQDSTWQAYRVEGNRNWFLKCSANNFRGNGIRVLDGDELWIEGCHLVSNRNAGRSAILIDPGSGADSTPSDDSDFRMYRAVIRDCYLNLNSDGSQESPAVGSVSLKLASAKDVLVEGCTIIAGKACTTSPNAAVRLEDSLYRTTFRNCYIYPVVQFALSMGRVEWTNSGSTVTCGTSAFTTLVTGMSVLVESDGTLPTGLSAGTLYYVRKTNNLVCTLHPTAADAVANTNVITPSGGSGTHYMQGPTINGAGAILQGRIESTVANNGGNVQYTISNALGTPGPGKTLFVRGSSVGDYNGPQQIIARDDFTVTTNRLYRSASIGSACVGHTGVDEVYFENCTFEGLHELQVYIIEYYSARKGVFKNCTFKAAEQETIKKSCINTRFLEDAFIDLFQFTDNLIEFQNSAVQWVIRPYLAPNRCFVTSGKVICYGNTVRNIYNAGSGAPGTTYLIDPFIKDETTQTYADRTILFATDGHNANRFRGTAAPTSALFNWARGDVVVNTTPSANNDPAFACVTAGSPGTWKAYANLDA